jgi:hypothetical protein
MDGPYEELSSLHTRNRLANYKKIADLQDAVRASIDRGCLRSLEYFFKPKYAVASRRTFPFEKLMERLLEIVLLPVRGERHVLAIDMNKINKAVERASLSIRERKKLRQKLLNDFDTEQGYSTLWEILLTLSQRGILWENLLGVEIGDLLFHHIQDICRFRHVAGLADAVHLSLLNLNVRVKFPEKVFVRSSSVTVPSFKGKMRFKGGDLNRGYILRNRFTTSNRRFHLIAHYLPRFSPNLPEKFYVRMIKENLVDSFCVEANQERPIITTGPLDLFPFATKERLDRRFQRNRREKIRFYKNLLESKSVCAPVGRDMIEEAYVKHRDSLCRPESDVTPVPEEYLSKLFKYGQRVGRFVEKVYDPHKTKLPNSRATVEASRPKGGARKALSGNIEIQKGPLFLSLNDGVTRVEPYVVGLFGGPGSGKTTLIRTLVNTVGKIFFPGLTGEDLVYSRSCATEHWDGYKGQPIVIMDDIGQDQANRSDLVEFEQLISVNPYVLPMAHLDDKGMKFTSPFVFTTSNMGFNSPLRSDKHSVIIEDDEAFWRRFHLPILVEKQGDRGRELFRLKSVTGDPQDPSVGAHLQQGRRTTFASHWRNYNVPRSCERAEKFRDSLDVCNSIVDGFRLHTDFHEHELTNTWRQNIACFSADIRQGVPPFYDVSISEVNSAFRPNDVTASMIFPRHPPYHPPVVEAIALPEPLKVRMITKAEAETKVLQPFQRALFRYLKSRPQFVLTHGVSWGNGEEFNEKLEWILRIESEIQEIRAKAKEGDVWLSGDYTAATDNFPLSVTNALIEGILSEISHEPTKEWVRYEVSPHTIRYPGLEPGQQTSGQLMGSLISFPLLCFLNDFIVQESGFEVGKYLVNGDDIVALAPPRTIEKWRENAPRVGLDLSIGKNFIDPNFCCVNSQLFYDGIVQHTGKVSCQTRYGKTLSRCYCEVQYYYGVSEEIRREFVRRNLIPLRSTPRSLDVPVELGGLGLVLTGRKGMDSDLATRVFIHDWLSPFNRSLSVPGYDHIRALHVPVGVFSDEEWLLGGGEPVENRTIEILSSLDMTPKDDPQDELTMSAFLKREKEYRPLNERVINQLRAISISKFPPLSSLRTKIVYVQKNKVGFLKSRVATLALLALHNACLGKVNDPEEEFIEIHSELLEESLEGCPLFSDKFLLPELEEIEPGELERYGEFFPGLAEKVYGGEGSRIPRIWERLLSPDPFWENQKENLTVGRSSSASEGSSELEDLPSLADCFESLTRGDHDED